MGKEKFVAGLKEMGYAVEDRGDNRVAVDYTIEDGRFNGRQIKLGFEVPPNFEIEPPPGPHISPQLLPLRSDGGHTEKAVASPFGTDWEYLSRPCKSWPKMERSVRSYMRHHVKRLLETL